MKLGGRDEGDLLQMARLRQNWAEKEAGDSIQRLQCRGFSHAVGMMQRHNVFQSDLNNFGFKGGCR